jgi:hypothetical protein
MVLSCNAPKCSNRGNLRPKFGAVTFTCLVCQTEFDSQGNLGAVHCEVHALQYCECTFLFSLLIFNIMFYKLLFMI